MTTSVQRPVRVVALIALVAVVAVLLLATAVAAATAPAGPVPGGTVTHRVLPGDTLWGIASTHTGDGDDVRETVFHIRRANDLDGSLIYPGQELVIPLG